jgi:glutamate/tyrosine decarboxylase-like PLP-dependent enzyme
MGGCAIFSDKYKHLLNGVKNIDSLNFDFNIAFSIPMHGSMLLINK